jgi:hypothetical protein
MNPAINAQYLTGSKGALPLEALYEAGYRGMEALPDCLDPGAGWRTDADRLGMPIVCVNAMPELRPYLTGSLSDNVLWRREKTVARLVRTLDQMRALAIPYLIVAPSRLAEICQTPDEARALLTQSLSHLSDAAGEDVVILLESAPFRLFATSTEIAEIIDAVARPNVAAALDIGHALLAGEEPAEAARNLGTRLRYVQLNDADTAPGAPRLDRHLPLGQGVARAEDVHAVIGDLPYCVNIVAPNDPVGAASASLAWLRSRSETSRSAK